MTMTTEPTDPLMLDFARVVQAVAERCLDDARADDPHLIATALQRIAAGDARLRMMIDFAPVARTQLLLIDTEGDEPQMALYTLTGRGGDPQ